MSSGSETNCFHVLLERGRWVEPAESSSQVINLSHESTDDPLLVAPSSLFRNFHSCYQKLEYEDNFKSYHIQTSEVEKFIFTFDSGSDVHVLTLEAAMALFTSKKLSTLRVVGVSGESTRADTKGRLVIKVEDPKSLESYHIDLGEAHGMKACPMNLLSISLLLKIGAVVHLEEGNSYFEACSGAERIPFKLNGGMFQLEASKGSEVGMGPKLIGNSSGVFTVACKYFATSGNLGLWHRRVDRWSASGSFVGCPAQRLGGDRS